MQQVKILKLEDLVLWTENPRDPINKDASDQDVVDRALLDESAKWSLPKLAKEMGDYYDFSELPTVVFHDNKPVVYDGNRRIILAKIYHKLVEVDRSIPHLPFIPKEIPCNVCDREIALKNILRKHGNSGSWTTLDRDWFLHHIMGEDMSTFLRLEETTGLISANPCLNKRFVKEEIFKPSVLEDLGFKIEQDGLYSRFSEEIAQSILDDLIDKIKNEVISTRKKRGQVKDVLSSSSLLAIEESENNEFRLLNLNNSPTLEENNNLNKEEGKKPRRTRRVKNADIPLFGEPLYLKAGDVSSLYLDITDLYDYYIRNKNKLSSSFPCLIRMSLRLLCETAANDGNNDLGKYIKTNFAAAKQTLSKDQKTLLANQNVREETMLQLLHTGAHNYKATSNVEQTIAISIILGAMLKISHKK